MSKLNFYYNCPTISSTPEAGLAEINKVNNLKRENKLLWTGIIILFAISTALLNHETMNIDVKHKKSS